MADIAMCLKSDCPMSDKCYRFKAKRALMQSYGVFDDCNIESDYKNFWSMHECKPKNPTNKVKDRYI